MFDLLQSFQLAFPTDNILIVPLYGLAFLQPSPQNGFLDLGSVYVKDGSILELLSNDVQPHFIEISAAPKHQSDPEFLLAVPNNWIAIQEPHRMRMPNLALSPRQTKVDLTRQYIAYVLVARIPHFVVLQNLWRQVISPTA